jgi:DNA-binding MarR family transcriptional regulator
MINLGTLSLGELGGEGTREPLRPTGRESIRKRPDPGSGKALAVLIEETVSLSRRLQAAVEELHGGEAPSGGRRALLRDLARLGPQTVPQLARSRSVTRQHVQALVNPLAKAGYVELAANPAHRRSRLVDLSQRGRELVSVMDRRESEALSALEVAAPGEELRRAADVLRSLRESLESPLG